MSTTALHIIQLVKSLPPAEQQAVTAALAGLAPGVERGSPAGPALTQADYEGLPDDDPFFNVMEEIERDRHVHTGRPAPDLD